MSTAKELLAAEMNLAQIELIEADIAAIEATARVENAREGHWRLAAAIAALEGAVPVETPSASTEEPVEASTPERARTAALSLEEFEKERARKARQRKKEQDALNPLAQYACAGCGSVGTSTEQMMQAPSGAALRMLSCSSCGNQTF